MDSSRHSRLTPLQGELLIEFFEREQRFFLTGGAALVGFYFGHRETEDLDLFCSPGPDLSEACRTMEDVAREHGASVQVRSRHPDFIRLLVMRGKEECVVDLAIDRAPAVNGRPLRYSQERRFMEPRTRRLPRTCPRLRKPSP